MLLIAPIFPPCPLGRPGDKVFRGCYSWRFTWLVCTYLIID
jgi:hypothetical protein